MMSTKEITDIARNIFLVAASIVVLLVGAGYLSHQPFADATLIRLKAVEELSRENKLNAEREARRLADVDAKKLEERLAKIEKELIGRE